VSCPIDGVGIIIERCYCYAEPFVEFLFNHGINGFGLRYKVPHGSPDLLVIERNARAIIAVTDSWTTSPSVTVATGFAQGTVLKDHSGAFSGTRTVGAGGMVEVTAASCDGTAGNGRRCYAIWGPESVPGYTKTPRSTTQEWEMSDDLGDSHPLSLQQGGRLPRNSVETRTAGRIFVEAGRPVSYLVYLSDHLNAVAIELYKDNVLLHTASNKLDFGGSYTPDYTGWMTIKARNDDVSSPGQTVWLVMTYRPPADVVTSQYDTKSPPGGGDWDLYKRILANRKL